MTLQEVDNESLHLTRHIDDAHGCFKTKFESLQSELARAKRSQADYEQEKVTTQMLLREEKLKALEEMHMRDCLC